MKAYDVVGFTHDGAAFCPDHKPEDVDADEVNPVFVIEEGWAEMVCDACRQTLGEVAGVV